MEKVLFGVKQTLQIWDLKNIQEQLNSINIYMIKLSKTKNYKR